jgi:SET domain-containing protein
MSIQCAAMTTARVGKPAHRCKNKTRRGIYCTVHQERDLGLTVAKSQIPNAGLGLNTTVPRKKGQRVTEYTGEVTSEDPDTDSLYVLKVAKHRYIDAADPLTPGYGRWLNDSRGSKFTNNTKFAYDRRKQEININATKNIKKNSELFLPYGRAYSF